ncbi:MAG: helix-turn-helix transcriptional regulator [Ruminococcaceae bacterium]|nr:helix-turn-helix transcriptional regulator [Oscillospiraceae bacterium]
MKIIKVKTMWPERMGFELHRRTTGDEYIFIHYLTPVVVVIDGKRIETKKGACIIYDKYSEQHFLSPNFKLLHDFIHFDYSLSPIMAKYGLEFNKIYYPINNDTITSIIQTIEKENISRFDYYEDICRLKIHELFTLLARNSNLDMQSHYADSETVARFTELRNKIHLSFEKNLTVDQMAAMVNLSPSRFHNLYKQIFGVSPKKDYLLVKIEHAKTLMADDKYSISQIAELSGYNNQYHFIRQFKEIVGVTPGKYLKNMRSTKIRHMQDS